MRVRTERLPTNPRTTAPPTDARQVLGLNAARPIVRDGESYSELPPVRVAA